MKFYENKRYLKKNKLYRRRRNTDEEGLFKITFINNSIYIFRSGYKAAYFRMVYSYSV
jgi:hypothetical protein